MNRFLDAIFRLSNSFLRPYPLCHSRPDRSLSYHGRYFGLCARCTGMYSSGVLAILATRLWSIPIRPVWLFLGGLFFLIPGGVDGFTQLLGERESTNRLRIVTGFLLGIGVVLIVDSFS
ncbi:DUF2085 domain-containing protein [Halobacterium salinarum]|nr:DUF2085 domain-containing protein [Halobacterium salinarum]MCF2240771.1 DUF2085 domain-containing protein [Halobacterium salinarum]